MDSDKTIDVKQLFNENRIPVENLTMIPGGFHLCEYNYEKGFPLVYTSDRFLKILGWTRAEIAEKFGNSLTEMVHPDYRDMDVHKNEELVFRLLGKNGYRWVSGIASVIEFGGKSYLNGSISDVTDFVERERKARQYREKLDEESEQRRIILDGLGSKYYSILLIDLGTGDSSVYRADERDGDTLASFWFKFDNSWSNVIGRYCESVVSSESRDEFREKLSFDYIKAHDMNYSFVYQTLRPECGSVYYHIKVAYVKNREGKTMAVVGTRNVDATIKKERAQERLIHEAKIAQSEAANKAKTDFLFNMSHDIRTPMNAIIGFTELLRRNIDDKEKALNYLEKIESSNSILLSLINNVLEMARIESGKESLDEAVYDVSDNGKTMHDLFGEQIRKKGLDLEYTLNVTHTHVIGDNTKMREIFMNIVSNAVKYTPSGGKITASITELPCDKPGHGIYQTIVEDTGIGMSQEFLPHIFEEFARERTSTISKTSGTGLGMPIVKRLVELMDGNIEVESKLGKGTKITVTIPHRFASHSGTTFVDDSLLAGEAEFIGKRILIAEDNELNAEIAMTLLEEEGFMVERAEDGIVCVNMLQKAPDGYYDLILMDVQMPNMDGYKATRVIRRLEDKKKAAIPIIAMTANAFDEDRRNAFHAGMNAHVAKPLDLETLNVTLSNALTKGEVNVNTLGLWKNRLMDSVAVLEFETEYRAKGIPIGTLIYEAAEEEKILFADDTLVGMFGCASYAEFFNLVGGSFCGFVHHDDLDWVQAKIRKMIHDSERFDDRVNYRIVRKDGAVRRVDDVGHKAFVDYNVPIFYVCIADITDSNSE